VHAREGGRAALRDAHLRAAIHAAPQAKADGSSTFISLEAMLQKLQSIARVNMGN
jgi:hypothetical protein